MGRCRTPACCSIPFVTQSPQRLWFEVSCLMRHLPCAHYNYVKPGGAAEKAGGGLPVG